MPTMRENAPGRQTAADVAEPGAPGCRRPRGRVQRPGPLPAGAARQHVYPDPEDRPRPAADPARRLRRIRPDLHPAAAPHPGRVHARPGGEPLRHRLPSGELPLARVELRRPDPAARRRPADDRRRLPRPRAQDDDARLPPRAGRGFGRGDDRRGQAGDRPPRRGRGRRRLRVDARPRDADRDAGTARPRSRRGRQRRGRRRALRAGAEFYGIDFALRFLRGPGSPWRKMLASRKVLDEIVFAEIAHRRRARRKGGWTSSASCSTSATRPARASPTARCATS